MSCKSTNKSLHRKFCKEDVQILTFRQSIKRSNSLWCLKENSYREIFLHFKKFWFPGNSWGSCCCVWWGFLLRMLHPTRNNIFINICKRKKWCKWKCSFSRVHSNILQNAKFHLFNFLNSVCIVIRICLFIGEDVFPRRPHGHDGSAQLQHQFYHLLWHV